MATDDEIAQFETFLWDEIEETMVNMNFEQWHETESPPLIFFEGLKLVIQQAHYPLIKKYKDTAVEPVLLESQRMVFDAIWSGMNVPYPAEPDLHMTAVCHNTRYLWNVRIYARLRTEMIMVNHSAHILQRSWRRVVTDPEHPACRRRLEYEFANLEQATV